MSQHDYLDELIPAFTPLLAIKEASRCLLCHDAPCSQSCPAETNPGKFIRSVYFRNLKGAAETIRENNALGAVCARVCLGSVSESLLGLHLLRATGRAL